MTIGYFMIAVLSARSSQTLLCDYLLAVWCLEPLDAAAVLAARLLQHPPSCCPVAKSQTMASLMCRCLSLQAGLGPQGSGKMRIALSHCCHHAQVQTCTTALIRQRFRVSPGWPGFSRRIRAPHSAGFPLQHPASCDRRIRPPHGGGAWCLHRPPAAARKASGGSRKGCGPSAAGRG